MGQSNHHSTSECVHFDITYTYTPQTLVPALERDVGWQK